VLSPCKQGEEPTSRQSGAPFDSGVRFARAKA
jgi:hypothetical protein